MEKEPKDWICPECGHEVVTMDSRRPEPIKWTDGHTCHFVEREEDPEDFSHRDPTWNQQKMD